jgi:hypothetical protein
MFESVAYQTSWGTRGWKPAIGTRVQWSGGPCGNSCHYWGIVYRLTKAQICINVMPTIEVSNDGTPSQSSWVTRPDWDGTPVRTEVAKYYVSNGWNCWAIKDDCIMMPLNDYDGNDGHNVSYY